MIDGQRSALKIVLKFLHLNQKLVISVTEETILDNLELSSIESTLIAISPALLPEQDSSAVSDTVSLVSVGTASSSLDESHEDLAIVVCTSSNSFFNGGTSLSLDLESQGVNAG